MNIDFKLLLDSVRNPKQKYYVELLQKHHGSTTEAAKEAGINKRNFRKVIERVERYAAEADDTIAKGSERELYFLRAQLKSTKQQLTQSNQELHECKRVIEVLEASDAKPVKPLKIKSSGKKRHKVCATAFLSDTHFDEVVTLEETGGVNEYNRKIAEKRLSKFAEKTIIAAHELMSGFESVHLDMPFGGDMVSGNIHDELARTNDAEIMDTVRHWSEKLAEVVITVSKEFPTVFIPCVVGNHGRNTKKPRHKGRIRDNFDWLIYQWCKDRVKATGVKNVRFDIATSTDVTWETNGFRYLLTHGDQASGGGGWGGIYSPIMRLYEKKVKAYSARGIRFDYLMMGHWHQFFDAGPVIVNGTTKGYDEFAHNLNFRPEPPQQAFWLTDKDKGKIFSGPLFVDEESINSLKMIAEKAAV